MRMKLTTINTKLIDPDEFDIEKYRIRVKDSKKDAEARLVTEFGFKGIPAGMQKYLTSLESSSKFKSRASSIFE